MKDRTQPRGSAAARDRWAAAKGTREKTTVAYLQCSWCKRTDVTWTNTPAGKMHVDCPKKPQPEASPENA